jgi:hypothetical protein
MRDGIATLQPICKHAQCEDLDARDGILLCGSVRHDARHLGDVGDPPPVVFPLNLDA